MNRLNLGFYSHMTFINSYISYGKRKLKHVYLTSENQWGLFSCVTQHVWASAKTNGVCSRASSMFGWASVCVR